MGAKSPRDHGRTSRSPRRGVSVAALAAIPAVMAAEGDGGDSGICHALGAGDYELVTAPETDFYGGLVGRTSSQARGVASAARCS